MLIILQKNDPRLGVLTHEGQYRWPAVNIAHLGYQIPNVQPHYVDEKPDDRGSRWFVILCLGYFDAEVHVGEVTTVAVPTLADLKVGLDMSVPDGEKTFLTIADSDGSVETHELSFDAKQPTATEETSDPLAMDTEAVEAVDEKPVSKPRGKGKRGR